MKIKYWIIIILALIAISLVVVYINQPPKVSNTSIPVYKTTVSGDWGYVDQWINQNYPNDPNIKKSLKMMASSIELETDNYQNRDIVLKEYSKDHSIECLQKASPKNFEQIMNKLQDEILNTSEKFKAYLQSQRMLSPQNYTYRLLNNDELTKYCGF
jgi:hypothetical protein